MAELIDKNNIYFRCSYGGECMANNIEGCKICTYYVCDYEDIQNVPTTTEAEIRNKAIEEFAEKMKELINKWIEKGIISIGSIDKIAEQLKESE